MKYLLAILLSLSPKVWASFPELFGPSAGSIAIGNQAEKETAANGYHAPSLLGYSRSTRFSFNSFYVDTDFKEINNVRIKNETTTVDSYEKGNVKTNLSPSAMFGFHFSTPLFAEEGPKLNLSVIAPFDRLMEADSGDPYRPRYIMYDNRFIRPSFILSSSQSFGDWSYSAGVQTGLQSNGETNFVTRVGNDEPSVAKISFNARPSIGGVLSASKRTGQNQVTYFTVHQEMKSELHNRATGETEVADSSVGQFDFDMVSLLYYDPLTLRLGHQIHFEESSLFLATEFQQWDRFEPSTLKLKKRGGTISGSQNFEDLKLRNLWIPKIGYSKKFTERWTGKMGYFYRASPIKTNNLKHAGNTIDVEKHIASVGAGYIFKVYQKDITLDVAYQLHLLRTQNIKKTSGLESGNPPSVPGQDEKIGSPGYEVGGNIHVLTAGLSWMY